MKIIDNWIFLESVVKEGRQRNWCLESEELIQLIFLFLKERKIN